MGEPIVKYNKKLEVVCLKLSSLAFFLSPSNLGLFSSNVTKKQGHFHFVVSCTQFMIKKGKKD
jgi:hypothetical protein